MDKREIPSGFTLDGTAVRYIRDTLCDYTKKCPSGGCTTCVFDTPQEEFASWLMSRLAGRK